jgi:hypothetical protein
MTTDYVGGQPARTNEINLKGYESALWGALSQSGEPFAGGSKRSRARMISVHRP